MKEITVNICSRNRREILKPTLLSLCDQTFPADQFEVVLVDDGSHDGTAEMIAELKPQLPYDLIYCYQEHAGLSTARNTGLDAANGEIILYIDDDVLAHRELLEQHSISHSQGDRIVVNGWVNHVTEAVIPEKPVFTMADISTSFFWTSNVSVKRQHLIECGYFDEDFTEYGWEDQEVGLRLMSIGCKKANNYKAIGYHVKKPPTYKNIEGAVAQAQAKARSAIIYIHKHPRTRTRLSTGAHPPRLAWAHMSNIGGLLEAFVTKKLQRPDGVPIDTPLSSFQQWCLKQLCTIHYFRVLGAH